jgi:hypothetical protein
VSKEKEAISIRVTPEFKKYALKACRTLGFNSIPEFLKGAAIAFAASQGIKPEIEVSDGE